MDRSRRSAALRRLVLVSCMAASVLLAGCSATGPAPSQASTGVATGPRFVSVANNGGRATSSRPSGPSFGAFQGGDLGEGLSLTDQLSKAPAPFGSNLSGVFR